MQMLARRRGQVSRVLLGWQCTLPTCSEQSSVSYEPRPSASRSQKMQLLCSNTATRTRQLGDFICRTCSKCCLGHYSQNYSCDCLHAALGVLSAAPSANVSEIFNKICSAHRTSRHNSGKCWLGRTLNTSCTRSANPGGPCMQSASHLSQLVCLNEGPPSVSTKATRRRCDALQQPASNKKGV